MSQGDYARAAAEFEPLISDTQKDIKVWLDYSITLLHIGQYPEALTVLERTQWLLHNDAEIQKERSADETAYLKAASLQLQGASLLRKRSDRCSNSRLPKSTSIWAATERRRK